MSAVLTTARELVLPLNGPQRQARAVFRPGNTVFTGWGRGVGKSKFARLMLWSVVSEWEHRFRTNAITPFAGVRITVLMPTLKQFKDVHWSGVTEDLQGPFAFLRARLDKQTGQINFPGGSWLKPFPASEYNSRTALGLRTDLLFIDECDSVPVGVYDAVAMPWLSEPWSLNMQLIAGTPNMGRHGLWWRTYRQGQEGARLRAGEPLDREPEESDAELAERAQALKTIYSFRAYYKDAPETVGARAVAKARATTLPSTFKREWEADPDAGEGLVYPFDESFHVRRPPPISAFSEFLVGGDHGWVDPAVLLLLGIQGHGQDATVWALDEWYESECPNALWDARARDWAERFDPKFWLDPSRPDRINDFKRIGCRVGESDNNILGGISRLADLLFIRENEDGHRWARFYVSPNCPNLIREFGLYRRKKRTDGTFDDDPEDRNNHSMDAARYPVVGRFGRGPNHKTVSTGR